MSKIIFQIDGGLGKSIIATAVCQAIKNNYPDSELIVVTHYPDVFLCNPNVDKCLRFSELSYFYSTHINRYKKGLKLFLHNPYMETNHILGKEHLIKTWCSMFGIEYNDEEPKIYLTQREIKFYSNQFVFEKPIMLIQTNGGAENQGHKYSWARDIPQKTAQYIVNSFNKEFDVLHIRRQDQLALQNTHPVHAEFRALAVLIKLSSKRLFIDSFAQHTAKALGLNSTVCWITNSPKVFGYENNINIYPNKENVKAELKNSIYPKYNIAGDLTQVPYESEDDIFDVETITESIKIME
jgi:hypothetical protein